MESMLYKLTLMNNHTRAIPPSVRRWIPKWAIVAVIAAIISQRWLSHHSDADVTLRTLIAILPIPIWLLWARSAAQRIRLLDEMQQLITYKAWFFAGLGTMFVMMALRQVQLAGLHFPEWLNHGLDFGSTFLLMAFLVIVGFVWANRRYK
jgi:hypothetical protein